MSLSVSTTPSIPPSSLQMFIREAQKPQDDQDQTTGSPGQDATQAVSAPASPDGPGQVLDVTA